jgi:Uma2 family endonuclease
VKEYWLVDLAARQIEVFTLKAGDYEMAGRYGEGDVLLSPLLEGLRLPVAQVLEEINGRSG